MCLSRLRMTIFTMHFLCKMIPTKKSGRDQQRGGQYEEEPPVITCFRNLWLLRLCWNFRLFRITSLFALRRRCRREWPTRHRLYTGFQIQQFPLPASALPSKVRQRLPYRRLFQQQRWSRAVTCSPFTRSG